MKNMKKMLSALTVLSLASTAAIGVTACSSNSTDNGTKELRDSFETSYKETAGKSVLSSFGITKAADGTFSYSFSKVDKVGLAQLITPKANAPIQKVVFTKTNNDFSPDGTLAAYITSKTSDGAIVSTGSDNTFSLVFTLELIKVVKQSDNSLIYVDQNDSLDVTVNLVNSPVDISTATVTDPGNVLASPDKTYGDLQYNPVIRSLIENAINALSPNTIQAGDPTHYKITNDQDASAKQTANTSVTFTVTANANDELVKNSFTFSIMLQDDTRKALDTVTIADSNSIEAYLNQFYSNLGNDSRITDLVINAINTQLSLTVSTDDIQITTDKQQTIQEVGTAVVFTVTAKGTSQLVEGKFTFTETLKGPGKYLMDSTQTPFDTLKMEDGQTYAHLNTKESTLFTDVLPTVFGNVSSGLWDQLNPDVDFNVTNDQDPNATQTLNTVIKFTVTAGANSILLVGQLTFSIQLGTETA